MIDLTREKGPVETLCKEIGFRFDQPMETPRIFVSFVSVLVSYIADERETSEAISQLIGLDYQGNPMGGPSKISAEVLQRVQGMLADTDIDAMIADAAKCHDFIREVLHSDEAYPTDHHIDMLSSCVSAIRFGLEKPCRSRHAAEAAAHVWKQRYGVRLFDSFTPKWQHDWACAQMQVAILRLAL